MTTSDGDDVKWKTLAAIGSMAIIGFGAIGAYMTNHLALSDHVSKIEAKLSEVAARQQVVFARMEKVESKADSCAGELVRREAYIKAFEKLERQVESIEQMLIEHNQRQLPLGKKSDFPTLFQPDG